jgi:glucan phosphoethanolaminetransferase (alkaline phosphatase superfamily)
MSIFRFSDKGRSFSVIPFILLISLIPLSEFINQFHRKEHVQAFVIFLWFLAMFVFPVFIFRKNIKIYLALLIPVYLVIPINILYMLSFNSELSADIMLLVFNTTRSETMELLKNYWVSLGVLYFIYIVILFLLYRKCPTTIPAKLANYLSLVCLVILLVFPFFDMKYPNRNYYDTARSNMGDIFPGNIIKGIGRHRGEMRMIRETEKYRQSFHFFAKRDTSIHDKQVIVLIIGESARYDHWAINGYGRNTSPHLAKRNNLLTFSNVSSGGYLTELAVPLLMTGVGAENFETHIRRKGVLGLFNEAGYDTYWISDQADGKGNIEVHTKEAQHEYNMINDQSKDKDMYILDTLNKVLKQPGDRKFIVIHVMGSHYDYVDRYPDEFDVFKPSYKTFAARVNDMRYKNVLINSYDNSIVYSDAVTDSIISVTSKLNNFSSVVYISDHGEDLLDNSRRFNYHINGSPPSKYVAHIPLFIWYSPQLQKKYPEKILNLSLHKNAAISSQNIIYTFSSLVGIHYPGQDSLKNVTSPFFKDNPQYFMGEGGAVYSYPRIKAEVNADKRVK